MEEEDKIEESKVTVLVDSSSGGYGESRWVDGSEVDSDPPSVDDIGSSSREGYGSIRRRLVKKPNRLNSLDVEAMEIAAGHGHNKVIVSVCLFVSVCR